MADNKEYKRYLLVFWLTTHKFMRRKKKIIDNTDNHLKLLILNQNIPFMQMDIYKIDNNIRQLISL